MVPALETTSTPKWRNGFVIETSGCRFAVPLNGVYGVVHAIEPVPVASPPRGVAGAVEVHGRTWDVVDLAKPASNKSRELRTYDPFLLTSHRGRDLALWAERSHGLMGYSEDDCVAADDAIAAAVEGFRQALFVGGYLVLGTVDPRAKTRESFTSVPSVAHPVFMKPLMKTASTGPVSAGILYTKTNRGNRRSDATVAPNGEFPPRASRSADCRVSRSERRLGRVALDEAFVVRAARCHAFVPPVRTARPRVPTHGPVRGSARLCVAFRRSECHAASQRDRNAK